MQTPRHRGAVIGRYDTLAEAEAAIAAAEAEIAPVRARREAAAAASDVKRLSTIHRDTVYGRLGTSPMPSAGGREIRIKRHPIGTYSTLRVINDEVWARRLGYYGDECHEYTGHVTDAALAAEIITLADRLGL